MIQIKDTMHVGEGQKQDDKNMAPVKLPLSDVEKKTPLVKREAFVERFDLKRH